MNDVYIGSHFCDDISFSLVVEIGQVERHDIIHHRISQVEKRLDAQVFDHAFCEVAKQVAEQNGNHNDDTNEEQATLCTIMLVHPGRIVIESSNQVEKMFRLRRQSATGWLTH